MSNRLITEFLFNRIAYWLDYLKDKMGGINHIVKKNLSIIPILVSSFYSWEKLLTYKKGKNTLFLRPILF
jgi:hypothetical protein